MAVSQHGSPEEKKRVRAAVRRKFPGIKQGGGKSEGKTGRMREMLRGR